MKNLDHFEYQGKRPNQIEGSYKIIGMSYALILIITLFSLIISILKDMYVYYGK